MEYIAELLSQIGLGVAANAIYGLIVSMHGRKATKNDWELALSNDGIKCSFPERKYC